jgi:hypothetical protein
LLARCLSNRFSKSRNHHGVCDASQNRNSHSGFPSSQRFQFDFFRPDWRFIFGRVRGKLIYRSDRLFPIAGRCFRLSLNRPAAALFHPLATLGSGFFAVPANREAAVNANAEQLASPPAERVTYERQGSDWVVSSGYRGDRIFYRRAMLACNGTKWRHIEFAYPASEKRHFDNFVTRTSFALRAYQDVGCGH